MVIFPFLAVPQLSTAAEPKKLHPICTEANIPSKGYQIQNKEAKTSGSSSLYAKHGFKVFDILFEAESQGYSQPSKEVISSFLSALSVVSESKLGIKSYTPIYEGGIAFDIYYGQKYIHVQFDNELDAAIYIREEGHTPKGYDMNIVDALQKLESLLA